MIRRREPMNRGKGLARVPFVRRGSSELNRTSALTRGRQLSPVSDATRARAGERAAVRERTAERAGWRCEAAELWPEVRCGGPLDTDETRARSRGGDAYSSDGTRLLCRFHHEARHAYPLLAAERGLNLRGYAPTAKPILTTLDEHMFASEALRLEPQGDCEIRGPGDAYTSPGPSPKTTGGL